jgi:Tfp pilus assembly protein PilO
MKKTLARAVHIIIIILVIASAGVFAWQLKTNTGLRKELDKKEKELEKSEKASRRLADLSKKSHLLSNELNLFEKKVPKGQQQPLDLIKTITDVGNRIGLRNAVFHVKTASVLEDPLPVTLGQDADSLFFEMVFEGTFSQTLDFLKAISELERLVSVEKMQIERGEDILPRQKVILNLVAYTAVKK